MEECTPKRSLSSAAQKACEVCALPQNILEEIRMGHAKGIGPYVIRRWLLEDCGLAVSISHIRRHLEAKHGISA